MSGDWFVWLGIKIPDLVAGFAGGVVNSFVIPRAGAWAATSAVVVGAITANYLAEPAIQYLGGHGFMISEPVASFLIGLGGMGLVQGIVSTIAAWRYSSSEAKK